jgi:hypothetical protein
MPVPLASWRWFLSVRTVRAFAATVAGERYDHPGDAPRPFDRGAADSSDQGVPPVPVD